MPRFKINNKQTFEDRKHITFLLYLKSSKNGMSNRLSQWYKNQNENFRQRKRLSQSAIVVKRYTYEKKENPYGYKNQ